MEACTEVAKGCLYSHLWVGRLATEFVSDVAKRKVTRAKKMRRLDKSLMRSQK